MTSAEYLTSRITAYGWKRLSGSELRKRPGWLAVASIITDAEMSTSLNTETHRPCDCAIELIDTDRYVARAMGGGGRYGVVISIGAIDRLQAFFHTVLSDPQTYPGIGHASLESPEDLTRISRHWHGGKIDCRFAPEAEGYRRPKCPIRGAFARLSAHYAMLFLVGHELTHVVNGHLELHASSGAAIGFIEEFEMASTGGGGDAATLPALTRQALETEADDAAGTSLIWNHFMHGCTPSGDAETEKFPMDVQLWALITGITGGLYCLDWREKVDEEGSHPPPIFRVLAWAEAASRFLTTNWPSRVELFDEATSMVVREFVDAVEIFGGGLPDKVATQEAFQSLFKTGFGPELDRERVRLKEILLTLGYRREIESVKFT